MPKAQRNNLGKYAQKVESETLRVFYLTAKGPEEAMIHKHISRKDLPALTRLFEDTAHHTAPRRGWETPQTCAFKLSLLQNVLELLRTTAVIYRNQPVKLAYAFQALLGMDKYFMLTGYQSDLYHIETELGLEQLRDDPGAIELMFKMKDSYSEATKQIAESLIRKWQEKPKGETK